MTKLKFGKNDTILQRSVGTASLAALTPVVYPEYTSVTLDRSYQPVDSPLTANSFGYAVGLTTNGKAVIGSPGFDSNSGRAYIYDVATGNINHIIENPNAYSTSNSDYFGSTIAVHGTNALICARWETGTVPGTSQSGIAYLVDTETGSVTRTFVNPNTYGSETADYFGAELGLYENYALISARGENSPDGLDDTNGIVYLFDITTGNLVQTIENPNANGTPGDTFGANSITIGKDYYAISARWEDVNGTNTGIVYVYDIATNTLQHIINNPNHYSTESNDSFSTSLCIIDNYLITSSTSEDSAGGADSGVVYIFDIITATLVHTITNPNYYGTSAGDNFGEAVSASGNYLVVSAHSEDDSSGTSSGKAYIFDLRDFSFFAVISNPNMYSTSTNDRFGFGLHILDDTVVVGAYGDENSSGTKWSGAAHVYKLT